VCGCSLRDCALQVRADHISAPEPPQIFSSIQPNSANSAARSGTSPTAKNSSSWSSSPTCHPVLDGEEQRCCDVNNTATRIHDAACLIDPAVRELIEQHSFSDQL